MDKIVSVKELADLNNIAASHKIEGLGSIGKQWNYGLVFFDFIRPREASVVIFSNLLNNQFLSTAKGWDAIAFEGSSFSL